MNGTLLGAAAFGAAFGGFTALSLAMDRHHDNTFGRHRPPRAQRRFWLRAAGALGLLLSLLACLAVQGPTQGWVLWCGVLTAGVLPVVLVQAYAPQRAAVLAWAVSALTLLLGLIAL